MSGDDPVLVAIRGLRHQFDELNVAQRREMKDLHDLLGSLVIRVADMETRIEALERALLSRGRGAA